MSDCLDDNLLHDFAHGFYGYGTYSASIWFVGMEEGGGGTFEEIERRLAAWAGRGRRELEDVAEYHRATGIGELFAAKPKRQPTWAGLIRMLLASQGEEVTPERVLAYQRDRLGRGNGETCLVELLPLPSPSTGTWLYAGWSGLAYLGSREAYREALWSSRIEHLGKRIAEHRPAVVVFYGLSYRSSWEKIAGVELAEQAPGVYAAHQGSSLFVAVRHPAARGVSTAYFHGVGALLSSAAQTGREAAPVTQARSL